MEKNIQYYLLQIEKAKKDKRGNETAPHKPILILSILQLYRNELISNNQIFITPELITAFKDNWNLLVETNTFHCKIALPFFHFKSSNFWKLIPKPGYELVIELGKLSGSLLQLDEAIFYAEIDIELCLLMQDKLSNQIMSEHLLDLYFPNTKQNFSINFNEQFEKISKLENKFYSKNTEELKNEIKELIIQKKEEELVMRSSIFRREITNIYYNTCAISRMKIQTKNDYNFIDACHIVPFAISYDDTVTNGFALCPNLHRAFDRGLIAIDDDYKVIVNKAISENENSSYKIKPLHGVQIQLPINIEKYPSLENFSIHRKKFGF